MHLRVQKTCNKKKLVFFLKGSSGISVSSYLKNDLTYELNVLRARFGNALNSYLKELLELYVRQVTILSAHGEEAKTAELAPSGFDVKSFPRQSRSRGGGIATVYKSTLGSSITFKTCFDFTHTSFEVVQASITLQHNTLHFFCLYRPPPNRRNNLTDSMFTEQLPNLLDYVNSLPGHVCLVGDMNIHFDNPLQSLTKQNLSTLSLYGLVQVINKPTHRCGHIIDWVIVRPDDDIH